MARDDRILRGVRTAMRSGTVGGRLSPGEGPMEMIDASEMFGFIGLDILFTDSGTIDFTYDSGTNKYSADYIGDLEDNANVVITAPADTEVLTYDSVSGDWINAASAGGGGGGDFLETNEIFHVRDEKSTGTNGGTSSTGDNTRTLNTVVTNSITGASLSSDQITLPAGTYYIRAGGPTRKSSRTRTFLYNISDSAVEVLGMDIFASTADNTVLRAPVEGEFTITGTKTFELRQYMEVAHTTFGYGIAVSDGRTEVYAEAHIRKINAVSIGEGSGSRVFIAEHSVASPGDTFIDFALSDTYDTYEIILFGVLGASNTGITFAGSADGGSTFETGASDYKSSSAGSAANINLADGVSLGASRPVQCRFTLTKDVAGVIPFHLTGDMFSSNSSGSGQSRLIAGYPQTGYNGASYIIDFAKIALGAGDMDDLTVSVWGITK